MIDAYCAGPQLYYRRCDIYPGDEAFKHDKIYRLSVARFSSRIDALSYIRKRGSEKDFKAWCSVLADELGGAGVPRIRKVKMTITAEINREEDEFLFSGRKSRF